MALDHALQDIAEVGEGLDVVELRALDYGGDDRPGPGTAVGAGKQMVLPAERGRPHGPLAVLVSISIRPSSTNWVRLTRRGESVADGGRERALGGDAAELRLEPGLEGVEDRPARRGPRLAALVGVSAADRFLHPVELGDPRTRLGGDRRDGRLVHVVELAPRMGPAVRQHDIGVFALGGQAIEAGECIHLERALEGGEMVDWVLVAAVFPV